MASETRRVVGITADLVASERGDRAECSMAYARAVAQAGGLPVLLPAIPELAAEHVRMCDAFVLTGGDDPRTEAFGHPTHPKAKPMHPLRQAYELRLLDELRDRSPQSPVLGVCLGMQLMALHAGGRLDQHLPETLASHAMHWGGEHPVRAEPRPQAGATADAVQNGVVTSKHRQAVAEPGSMLILAKSEDGVIEAVGDPHRPFYVGVQWHPERTAQQELGPELFRRLVAAVHRSPSDPPGPKEQHG
jgi:putative glutamine amidotransferase